MFGATSKLNIFGQELFFFWVRNLLFLISSSVQPMPRGDNVLNYSDAEDMLKDESLK